VVVVVVIHGPVLLLLLLLPRQRCMLRLLVRMLVFRYCTLLEAPVDEVAINDSKVLL